MILWRCTIDSSHTWRREVRKRTEGDTGCPDCRSVSRSFGGRYPELRGEWHSEKNEISVFEVFPSNSIRRWWQCQIHLDQEWQASIKTRVNGGGKCPVCFPRSQHNTKPTVAEFGSPLTEEWDFEKNGDLRPEDFTVGSNQKIWWRCSVDPSHSWPSTISNRARLGRGCPECAFPKSDLGERSLESRCPSIANEWHPTKNDPVLPKDVPYGSQKTYWWKCKRGHEWTATVTGRTAREGQCPFCSGKRVAPENSLKSKFPEIAGQWHPIKNGDLEPESVTARSGEKVWWICPLNPAHEWPAIIRNRTVQMTGCSTCGREKRSVRIKGRWFRAAAENSTTYKQFVLSIKQALGLLTKTTVDTEREQAFNRMVYSAIIVAMEVYLGDSFTQAVASDRKHLQRVMRVVPDKTQKYSADDLIKFADDFEKSVLSLLSEVIWHNLDKVRKFYGDVLRIEFDERILPDLHRAIEFRHDIVHRNGISRKWVVRRLLHEEIIECAHLVCRFVEDVEGKLQKKGLFQA